MGPIRVVCRILALIFTYDGDSVGCGQFIKDGWPFSEVDMISVPGATEQFSFTSVEEEDDKECGDDGSKLQSPQDEDSFTASLPDLFTAPLPSSGAHPFAVVGNTSPISEVQLPASLEKDPTLDPTASPWDDVPDDGVRTAEMRNTAGAEGTHVDCKFLSEDEAKKLFNAALLQVSYKEFEPFGECEEMMLCFLWVLFFTPVMPIGIFATLGARIMEIKFDLTKLLYVRQRAFPEADETMCRLQSVFTVAASWASIGWCVGLSMITYNDDFCDLTKTSQNLYLLGVTSWMAAAIVWALAYNEWKRLAQLAQEKATLAANTELSEIAMSVVPSPFRSFDRSSKEMQQ
eukprot:gnl/TRDRNA2_/TRDRNA2_129100_c1_seq1.p1 gnl/TRDRNA2_/TRDRNA2_129100_c1~~gnl/TRDRNA2_/TRDRNA2_129100_c1_seq1.p1  ORF type:complete len:404 (+),score=57.42 gnl/TRDRNA2_/TRDRNA2_129100_c1_seq1:177-1214(+)